MSDLIWLANITAGVAGSPTETVLRVASSQSGYNHPTAPGFFAPRLIEAVNMQRNIVAPRRTFGRSQIGAGEIRINNVDGEYDEYFDYGYGFEAEVLLGEQDDPYGYFTTIMKGRVEQPTGTKDDLIFRFRDRQLELDRLVSPSSYLGNNDSVSPTLLTEGRDTDIKGQNKIRVFGRPHNVQLDPVDIGEQMYACNHDKDGVLSAVDDIVVRVNGSDWSDGTAYSNVNDLLAGSPTQGIYDNAFNLSLVRLGGSLDGTVTADIIEKSDSSPSYSTQNEIASVIERLLLDAGVAAGDINVELDSASPSQAPWQVGLVVRNETYRQALDMLTEGSAVWYAPNRLGVYQVRKFSPPGTATAGFKKFDYPNVAKSNEYQILDLERVVTGDQGRGVPAWKITVNYLKMWTVQSKDGLASGLSEDLKELYSREYRSVTVEDATIRDQFPEATELVFDTLLVEEGHATDLADHLLVLYGTQRNMYKLTAKYNVPVAQAIDLGDTVTVTYNRYGLDAGKDFVITGIRYNAKKYEIELELWG